MAETSVATLITTLDRLCSETYYPVLASAVMSVVKTRLVPFPLKIGLVLIKIFLID